MTQRNRVRLLVVLLCVWGLASLAVFGFSNEPERVPLQNVTGAVALVSGTRGESRSPGLQVNLTLFEAGRKQRAQNFSPPKNIFSWAPAAASTPVEPDTGVPGATGEPLVAAAGGAGSATSPDGLQYLGYMERGDGARSVAVAVLAAGDDLHMVRAGERFGTRFRVKTISAEQVILVDPVSRREQILPLVDVAPSAPTS